MKSTLFIITMLIFSTSFAGNLEKTDKFKKKEAFIKAFVALKKSELNNKMRMRGFHEMLGGYAGILILGEIGDVFSQTSLVKNPKYRAAEKLLRRLGIYGICVPLIIDGISRMAVGQDILTVIKTLYNAQIKSGNLLAGTLLIDDAQGATMSDYYYNNLMQPQILEEYLNLTPDEAYFYASSSQDRALEKLIIGLAVLEPSLD